MKTILTTETFDAWFSRLRDQQAQARIKSRLRRVELSNVGDCKAVGEGVSELRIDYGPGYRLYFMQNGLEIIVLLAGGDKSSQQSDIQTAQRLAKEFRSAT